MVVIVLGYAHRHANRLIIEGPTGVDLLSMRVYLEHTLLVLIA